MTDIVFYINLIKGGVLKVDLDKIVEKVRGNDVVLWVGSGFSLYSGMPSANQLREILIENASEEDKKYFENKNLSEVADTFVKLCSGSKNELYLLLQNAFDKEPVSLEYHKLLSEIPQIDLIVTTNYDKLFEEAYGRDISIIVSGKNLPLAKKRVQLYKIHGDICMPETIMLTKNEYTDFFRNQDKPLWNKIKTFLAEKTIIFLGYSLADQNIQYLLDNIANDMDVFIKESYLIAPNMPKHEVDILIQKKIKYIDMTGEKFVEELHSKVKKNS